MRSGRAGTWISGAVPIRRMPAAARKALAMRRPNSALLNNYLLMMRRSSGCSRLLLDTMA